MVRKMVDRQTECERRRQAVYVCVSVCVCECVCVCASICLFFRSLLYKERREQAPLFRSLKSRTNRLNNSFFPWAIRRLNTHKILNRHTYTSLSIKCNMLTAFYILCLLFTSQCPCSKKNYFISVLFFYIFNLNCRLFFLYV